MAWPGQNDFDEHDPRLTCTGRLSVGAPRSGVSRNHGRPQRDALQCHQPFTVC